MARDEAIKLTLRTKPYGYTGEQYASALRAQNIVCEFADPDFVVLMFTPETGETGLVRLEAAMLSIPRREAVAAASVGCPPAVPIVVCGERISSEAVRCFAYYGIETCTVVME